MATLSQTMLHDLHVHDQFKEAVWNFCVVLKSGF